MSDTIFIRDYKPEDGNPFYNTYNNGGYSTCILGNSDAGRPRQLNVLPNCVGFANGAFNETIDSVRKQNKQYYSFNSNAKRFIELAQNFGLQTLSREDTPTIGGVMVWKNDGAGHVAYVYDVIDENTVCTVESNWSGPLFRKYGPGGDYGPRKRGSNGNWGYNTLKYIGCVVNPVVADNSQVSAGYRPFISSIEEDNGKIKINCNCNTVDENLVEMIVKCKFKDADDNYIYENESNNPLEVVVVRKREELDKDANSNILSRFIVEIDDYNYPRIQVDITKVSKKQDGTSWEVHGSTFTKDLEVITTINCANIYCKKGNEKEPSFHQAIPYIYLNGEWNINKDVNKIKPYIYLNGSWVEIVDTLGEET